MPEFSDLNIARHAQARRAWWVLARVAPTPVRWLTRRWFAAGVVGLVLAVVYVYADRGDLLMRAVSQPDAREARLWLWFDPTLVDWRSSVGQTPLHRASVAGRAEVAALLLAKGAAPQAVDREGRTPLHRCNDPAVAAALLDAGADLEARDSHGHTPLMTVLDPRVLHVLLARGADVHSVDGEGMPALNHHAAELQATYLLLTYGAPPNQTTPSGQTPLMTAGAWNAAESVWLLLRFGAMPNAADREGDTALHYATRNGARHPRSLATVTTLVRAGASPTRRNVRGFSSLDVAGGRDRRDLLELLRAAR